MMRHFIPILIFTLIAACAPGETEPPAQERAQPETPKRGPGEIFAEAAPEDWRTLDPENLLVIELERGRVFVALSEKLAQAHVKQVKTLVRDGFYDGLSFYRVIDGFVAQGGDLFEQRDIKSAEKAMTAEAEQPLTPEMGFTPIEDADGYAAKAGFIDSEPVGADAAGETVWRLHCAGAFAFGRNNDINSASTEFYITLQPQRYLDRNLTVFGQVVSGMEHIQALRRVAPAQTPEGDLGETILSMRIAADLPEGERPALEILRSDTQTFADYVESRRNRPEDFFYYRPDHVDICALTVPVRAIAQNGAAQ